MCYLWTSYLSSELPVRNSASFNSLCTWLKNDRKKLIYNSLTRNN